MAQTPSKCMPPSLTKSKAVWGCQGALLNTLFKLTLEEMFYHGQQSKFKVTSCANIQQQKEQVYGRFLQARSGSGLHHFCSHSTAKEAVFLLCAKNKEKIDWWPSGNLWHIREGSQSKFSIGLKLRRWDAPTFRRCLWPWYLRIQGNIWEGQFFRGFMEF